MAKCDQCGEGLTALERRYRLGAKERQIVEETLDDIADGWAGCWVSLRELRHVSGGCTERQGIGEMNVTILRKARSNMSYHWTHVR